MDNKIVMHPQDFTVKSWNPWMADEEEVRDAHGNYKGNVTFEEYSAQPVDATFKQPPNSGDKKYGQIEEYQTKTGKTRIKFKRVDKPQEGFGTSGSKPAYQPRDDAAIKAQWAIGQAVSMAIIHKPENMRDEKVLNAIEDVASQLYAMVDRVKVSGNVPPVSDEELASLERHNN